MTGIDDTLGKDNAVLIYDGECPVCSNYVGYVRLRKALPGLVLQSARDPHSRWVIMAKAAGIDLNREMALLADGRWFKGPEVIQALARLGRPGLVERLVSAFVGEGKSSLIRYGILVRLRLLLLAALGRKPL